MTWDAWFHGMLLIFMWLMWLWITQPRYEDGRYVTVGERIRKVSKRIFCKRNKSRADDS